MFRPTPFKIESQSPVLAIMFARFLASGYSMTSQRNPNCELDAVWKSLLELLAVLGGSLAVTVLVGSSISLQLEAPEPRLNKPNDMKIGRPSQSPHMYSGEQPTLTDSEA